MKQVVSILIIFFLLTPLWGQTVSEQSSRKKQLEEEIAFLDKQLSSTISKQQANTKELDFIRKKISSRKKLITELEKEIAGLDSEVTSREATIGELNAKLAELKKSYSILIYQAYKHRDKTNWIMHILASRNIGQGYRRWSYFRTFHESIRQMADEINRKTDNITREKEELAKARTLSLSARLNKQKEFETLSREEKKAKDVTARLSKKEKEMRQQITSKRKEVERLNREIERILAEAASEKKSPEYKDSEVDRKLSENFGSNKGKLPWPVKAGVIVDEFGQHNHPVFKNITLPFNNGVNIAANTGADVYSVFEGVVKQILVMPGYNQCVLIQHGDYFTFYTKLDKLSVKSGEKVSTLQKIGSLAVQDDGSILHFQLWHGTVKQNPAMWISR